MEEKEKEKESENVYKFTDRQNWFEALQESPDPSWLKERSLGGAKKHKYIPLPIQEALADLFFREFDVVAIETKVVVNEILLTVKIQFLPNYPDSDHRYMVGIASKPIQQSSGSFASQFPDGKISNSLEYNAPAVRSAAISNALTSFANVFGRNLGREVKNDFSFSKKKKTEEPK
jgi:hypothetical protein